MSKQHAISRLEAYDIAQPIRQLFPANRLKNPSRSSSSKVLSSRYLFMFMSILAPGVRWESSSKVLRRPTWDTRVGNENFLAKY